MNDFIKIDIRDEASLFEACDYLHDAKFSRDDVVVDANAGRIVCTFKRADEENDSQVSRTKICPGFYRVSYPAVRSVLTLTDILELKIGRESGAMLFNEVQSGAGWYDFLNSVDKWRIKFKMKPTGALEDIALLEEKIEWTETDTLGSLLILGALLIIGAVVVLVIWLLK
jgi:hypothetical protein